MPEQDQKERKYRSLWPLPGGHGRFLATLLEILEWASTQSPVSYDALYDWMRQRYALGPDSSTPAGYTQTIARIGFIAPKKEGHVAITDRGKLLLQTRNANVVLDPLLRECIGTYDVLAMVSRLGTANGRTLQAQLQERYPYWSSPNQFEWRLQWLHSLGCLERSQDGYVITSAGQRALQNYAGLSSMAADSSPIDTLVPIQDAEISTLEPANFVDVSEPLVLRDEAERLADKVRRAALESDDAASFEHVLVDAFRFLGFQAQHRGGPSDTDVLVTAPLGQETYRVIIDGKSSRHGKIGKQQIDWYALERHKALHKADYILVVAPGFSSGDLLDNASKAETALVTSDDLAAIMRLHASTPLSLADLRELFRYSGHPELPLQRIQEKAAEVARLQRLLPDIIRTFEHSYSVGVSGPIAADALHLILARDYGRAIYSKDEIIAALDLLCTPLIGALRRVADNTYTLQMPVASVARRFQAQATQLHDSVEHQDLAEQMPRGTRIFP